MHRSSPVPSSLTRPQPRRVGSKRSWIDRPRSERSSMSHARQLHQSADRRLFHKSPRIRGNAMRASKVQPLAMDYQ